MQGTAVGLRVPFVEHHRRASVHLVFGLLGVLLVAGLAIPATGLARTVPSLPSPAPVALSAPPAMAIGAPPPALTHAPPAHPARAAVPPPFSRVHLGPQQVSGPHLSAWGQQMIPPGAPLPNGASANSTYNKDCYGVWPAFGQSYYENGCYGHDEPNLNFYTDLPGSGGNVTWNVTLPTDADATHNQSSLYSAIWFGMTLNDPFAWMNQCFLELQFYPDQTWYNPDPFLPGFENYTVNGAWVGEVWAWQIEAATGYEDACFNEPLYLHDAGYGALNGSFLNMTQGDHITVTMQGWLGSPYGENLTIVDQTNGQWSEVNMYNYAQNYPLDPSYTTQAFENGLQWTPGGESPVSFAFENGHTIPPYPNNNSFGGCSPGWPPSTTYNPAVPCPSYDPGSWSNDTQTPWFISTPSFYNATASATPSQVGFGQDFGGIAAIDGGISYDPGCIGNEGSAWCTYPWWSYSCSVHAFEFGATDFPGVTNDFGKWTQFNPQFEVNHAGWGYYPATNASIPACDAPRASLALSLSGAASPSSVYFLSTPVGTAGQTFDNLSLGEYSIHALAAGGQYFEGWQTSGGVVVSDPNGSYTTVTVDSSGALVALFGLNPPMTTVVLRDSPSGPSINGTITVLPSYLYGDGSSLGTFPSNGSIALTSGLYALLANPPAGYNFTGWQVLGSGAFVESPAFPFTGLVVQGSVSSVVVEATYAPSSSNGSVFIYVIGPGSVTFDGTSVSSSAFLTVPVGAYAANATPSPGATFTAWYYYSSAVMADFSASTWVTLENGSSYLEADFRAPNATLGFAVSAGASGGIDAAGSYQPNGTTQALATPSTLPIAPAPGPGEAFAGWSVSNPAALWVLNASNSTTLLVVNASGTLTVNYVAAAGVNLTFLTSPASGGSIEFNLVNVYANGSENDTLANGTYPIAPLPASGFAFVGWSTTGPVSVGFDPTLGDLAAVVGGANGTVTFVYAPIPPTLYAVTFVSAPSAVFSATVNGIPVGSGDTAWLPAGSFALALVSPSAPAAFSHWTTAGALAVANVLGSPTTITVSGGGTVYALSAGPGIASFEASPASLTLGTSTTLVVSPSRGDGPWSFSYVGLPGGCASADAAALTCTPGATGSSTVSVTVTDAFNLSTTASTGLQVNAVPAVTAFGATPGTVTAGVPTTLAVTVAGGTGPFTYEYSALPRGCGTADTATLACTPSAPGSFTVNVSVTDASGVVAVASAFLAVNPAPAVTAFVAAPASVASQSTTYLNATVTGGTGPLTYRFEGLPAGCTSENTTHLACRPTTEGSYTVTFVATDAFGVNGTAQATLNVTAPPAAGSPTFAGLPIVDWAILAAVIVIAAILVGLATRRRTGSTPPAPWEGPKERAAPEATSGGAGTGSAGPDDPERGSP